MNPDSHPPEPREPSTDPGVPLRQVLRPSGPPRLHLSTQPRPDGILVRVEGELDILTAPKLAAQMNDLIRSGPGHVVLDLREVLFIDSAGLQMLLSLHRRLNRRSRKLTVACEDGPVRRVIEMSRLGERLGLVRGGCEATG